MTITRLHDYFRSSAAYRVRIALNLKGVRYETVVHDLRTGEQRDPAYLAANPQGLVPALEIDGRVLTQSLAIIDYLDARFPAPRLLPADPGERADALAAALVVACDVHPLNNLRVLKYLKHPLGRAQDEIDAWYRHWVTEGLAPLEAMAARRRGRYLGGGAPDIADVCLVPQLYNARRFDCPLDRFPRLVAADAALADLTPVADAHPDRVAAA